MIKERICFAVIFLVEAAIAWFYFSHLYSSKKARPVVWTSFAAGYTLLFVLSSYRVPAINMSGFFITNLFILLICYNRAIKSSMLQAAFLTFSNGAAEVLSNLVLVYFGSAYNAYTYSFTVMLALSIVSKLVYLIIVFVAVRILKPQFINQTEPNATMLLGVMPTISVFIVVTMSYICIASELESVAEILVTISMLALLLANLAILIL